MDSTSKPAIISIGIANPPYSRPQQDTADFISTALNLKPAEKRLLKSVYKATGIQQRYSVLKDYSANIGEFTFFPNHHEDSFPATAARMQIYKDNALQLAITAIKNNFASLENFDPRSITHLITVSCTGMYAPGIDIEIAQQLNLNTQIKRTAVNFMGCYGAFNGIKVAESICKAEPNAVVLMVSVEICTIHFQKSMSLDNVIANSIFADGAAALLIQNKPNTKKYLTLEKFHCDLMPQTDQAMAWTISDNGFDIVLSSYVPEIINTGIAGFTNNLLQTNNLTINDIDIFAIHPGGLKILQACEEALNITKEQNKYSYKTLNQYGNMSSATVLFVLKAIWEDIGTSHHNKNVFSCAFGPGLTLESMLLKAHVVN